MGAVQDLRKIVNKLWCEAYERKVKDDVYTSKLQMVARTVSIYLDSHLAVTTPELIYAVTDKKPREHPSGQSLCLPATNKYLRDSREFRHMTLGEAAKCLMDHEVIICNVAGSRKYSINTPIFFKTEKNLRQYIKQKTKEVKRVVHYRFDPTA